MRIVLLIASSLIITCSFSQTGPGGVGTAANNVLWLKADAGTSTTVTGAAVSGWNDQSGNTIDVSQPVVAQQPLYQPGIINGFPALQFDNNSASGQNDKLIGPDSPILDNTAGYSFFTISRPQSLATNAIVSKRVDVGVHQSFMLFYWTGSKFNVDIQTNNDRFASTATFSNNTNYLLDVIYDGTLPAASRTKLYIGEDLHRTAYETSSMVADNASPLLIGSTHLTDDRPFAGYISEVVIYREALNKASRIIVNNYLSAKYNSPLTINDKYAGDDAINGDYDREVAGIGKDTIQPGGAVGSNAAFAASVSGGLGIASVSGFDVGDYILAGHRTPVNAAITTDIAGLTGSTGATAPCRWQRIWYVDITNTGAANTVNIQFDMSDGGVSPVVSSALASDYVLLYRPAQTGAWTLLTTANAMSGDKVLFNSYALTLDGYYTIGSKNCYASPLPVELTAFDAVKKQRVVELKWATASETENAFFTIERSTDGISWTALFQVEGAGTTSSEHNYLEIDAFPENGINYYRLKQTDANGEFSYSEIRSVVIDQESDKLIFPNPAGSQVFISWNDEQDHTVQLVDLTGRILFSAEAASEVAIPLSGVAAGNYLLRFEDGSSEKLMIE